jgi:hypothetical protein
MIEEKRFTAYKMHVDDQSFFGHVPGITLDEVRDETRFPLGPQKDSSGRIYVWRYGLNDGNKI